MDQTERQIRIACIDVFDEPANPAARAVLADLINTATAQTPAPAAEDAESCLRTACTDLHDEPRDRATQLHVLELLSVPPRPSRSGAVGGRFYIQPHE